MRPFRAAERLSVGTGLTKETKPKLGERFHLDSPSSTVKGTALSLVMGYGDVRLSTKGCNVQSPDDEFGWLAHCSSDNSNSTPCSDPESISVSEDLEPAVCQDLLNQEDMCLFSARCGVPRRDGWGRKEGEQAWECSHSWIFYFCLGMFEHQQQCRPCC